MTIEKVILQIRRDLIRSISGLDAWFDKDHTLLELRAADGTKTVRELIEEVAGINRHLLGLIDQARTTAAKEDLSEIPADEYCLMVEEINDALMGRPFEWQLSNQPLTKPSLEEVRYEIREQLDRCLIHLELLMEGEGNPFKTDLSVANIGRLDVYQSIYFLALHVRRFLCELDAILEDHNGEMQAG